MYIGQFPADIRSAGWEFIAYLRNDKTLDQQVDDFLLEAKEGYLTRCYGPELIVMLEKLEARIKVTRPMFPRIMELINERN